MNVKLTESPRFTLTDVRSAGNTDINAPAVENIQYTCICKCINIWLVYCTSINSYMYTANNIVFKPNNTYNVYHWLYLAYNIHVVIAIIFVPGIIRTVAVSDTSSDLHVSVSLYIPRASIDNRMKRSPLTTLMLSWPTKKVLSPLTESIICVICDREGE